MEFADVVSGLDVEHDVDGGRSFPIKRLFGYGIILHKRALSLAISRVYEEMRVMCFTAIDTGRMHSKHTWSPELGFLTQQMHDGAGQQFEVLLSCAKTFTFPSSSFLLAHLHCSASEEAKISIVHLVPLSSEIALCATWRQPR